MALGIIFLTKTKQIVRVSFNDKCFQFFRKFLGRYPQKYFPFLGNLCQELELKGVLLIIPYNPQPQSAAYFLILGGNGSGSSVPAQTAVFVPGIGTDTLLSGDVFF